MTAFLSDCANAPTILIMHASQAQAEHIALLLAANGMHGKAVISGEDAIEEALSGSYAALITALTGPDDISRLSLLREAGYMRPIIGLKPNDLTMGDELLLDEILDLQPQQNRLLGSIKVLLAQGGDETEEIEEAFHQSALFVRLRHSFLASLADSVEQIERAFAARDWEGAGHLVHALKGTAASFGFSALAHSSRRIETLLRTDCKPDAQLGLKELRSQTAFLLG